MAVAAGRARPANVPEILAHMLLGDRVSERTVDQFRAAGKQQGFVDVGVCAVKWRLVNRTKSQSSPL